MLVIGSLAGGGGRPGTWVGSVSTVTSDISRNSRSRIFLTTFVGREADGLNGPVACRSLSPGIATVAGMPERVDEEAAAANMSSPETAAGSRLGMNDGNLGSIEDGGSVPRGVVPVWIHG